MNTAHFGPQSNLSKITPKRKNMFHSSSILKQCQKNVQKNIRFFSRVYNGDSFGIPWNYSAWCNSKNFLLKCRIAGDHEMPSPYWRDPTINAFGMVFLGLISFENSGVVWVGVTE